MKKEIKKIKISEENKKILQLSIISALSYLDIGKMSVAEKKILKSNDTDAKSKLLSEKLMFENKDNETISDYEYLEEINEVLKNYEFLDFYREDLIHHRQMIAMRNKESGKVVFGVRGTAGLRDVFTDAMIGARRIMDFSAGAKAVRSGIVAVAAVFPMTSAGVLLGSLALAKFSKIFTVKNYMNSSEEFIKKVMERNNIKKEDVIVTGHSLGAIMSQLISARTGVEGHGFNGLSIEHDLLTPNELKHLSNNYTTHSFHEDLLTKANGLLDVHSHNGKRVKYNSFADDNMLSSHSIINFNKGLIRWMKTSELLNNEENIEELNSIMKEHGKRKFMEMFLYKMLKTKEHEKQLSLLNFKEPSQTYFKHFKDEEILHVYDLMLLNNEDNQENLRFLIDKTNQINKQLSIFTRIQKIKDLSHYHILKTKKQLNKLEEKQQQKISNNVSEEVKQKNYSNLINNYEYLQY